MDASDLQNDNQYRALSSEPLGNASLGRQFLNRPMPPRVARPQVWMQPSQEATLGGRLGNSWKTTPMGIGRPITPTSSAYMKPVVL